MKPALIALLAASAFPALLPFAMSQEEMGSFCIINAVEDGAPLFTSVDGTATTETGYVPGEFSGLLGYRTGRAKLEAKCGDLLPLEAPLPLRNGDRVWLVFYKALIQKEGEPEPVPALQVLAAPEPPPRTEGYHISTLLVGATAPASFSVGGQPVQLIPGKPAEIAIKSAALTLKSGEETLAQRDLEVQGNFLLVLFPHNGSYGHVLIYL